MQVRAFERYIPLTYGLLCGFSFLPNLIRLIDIHYLPTYEKSSKYIGVR